MKVTFLQNLGSADAEVLNKECKCNVKWESCKIGKEVDIPSEAVDWINNRYKALIGVAPAAKIQAVPPERK